MSEHDEHELELVMPFVVVTSAGGPLDDHAFVCGARYGALAERLALPWLQQHTEYVEPDLLPQIDLLAMHHGFTITAEPWAEHADEWVRVDFERTHAKGDPNVG